MSTLPALPSTLSEKINQYCEQLIVHGLNVQPGDLVRIGAEPWHRELCIKLAEVAYKRGAKAVSVELEDPRLSKLHLTHSSDEGLTYVPRYLKAKFDEMVADKVSNLRIVGPEFPLLLENVDPERRNLRRLALYEAQRRFIEEAVSSSSSAWSVAAAPTPAWSLRIYPDLAEQDAYSALWGDILHIARLKESWEAHDAILQRRASILTEAQIKTLHFTGPGTDLEVSLSPLAIFKGGSENTQKGVKFNPNIPTEEVFTTPDCRHTKGIVRCTRPFLVNGTLVSDLVLEFHDGGIVKSTCSSGADTFNHYTSSDPGAARLGEVALVGIDSPIFQKGRVYEEILIDENAACHIAVGSAYKFCIRDSKKLSKEELAELGVNESSVHTDMMISNEHVSVSATTFAGEVLSLITNGSWEKQWR